MIAAPSGSRLPDATSVGRVHLQVSDLGRSLDYYEGVLGLHRHTGGEGTALLGTERVVADPWGTVLRIHPQQ